MKTHTRKNRGLFIIFEGLDMAGKTTLAKMLVKKLHVKTKVIYRKGIGSPAWIGKASDRFPSTFLYLLELIYIYLKNYFQLKKEVTIIQDRYFASVACHLPITKKPLNAFLLALGKIILPQPDILIYCTVDKSTRIKRLELDAECAHHQNLINNHKLIDMREGAYCKYFKQFKNKKITINTTLINPKQSVKKILNSI